MRTRIEIEQTLGDAIKVIAYQIDHLWEIDDLQCDEILALIEGRLLPLKTQRAFARRPKASSTFLKYHNSDNEYTLTKSRMEVCASDRLDVIEDMAKQIITHERLKPSDVVKLCESYIRMHLTDGEDAGDLPSRPPKD